LDDALEAERLVISLATVAIKELFAQRFGMRLELGVKNPLHVFESQFLGEGTLGRVHGRCFAGRPCGGGILGDLGVESCPNVEKRVNGEPGAVLSRNLLAFAPSVSDDFVCITSNPNAQGSLCDLPILVNAVPSLLFCR
jgi:hypothetical protein